MMEDLQNEFEKLSLANESEKISILYKLQSLLLTTNWEKCDFSTLNLNSLFDLFASNNSEEETRILKEILIFITAQMEASYIIQNYSPTIHSGLSTSNSVVKITVLKILQRCNLHLTSRMIEMIIDSLSESDDTVRSEAFSLLVHSQNKILIPSTLAYFSRIIVEGKDDISRFKIYELLIVVSLESSDYFQKVLESKLLSHLFNELTGDDVLNTLNAYTLLDDLLFKDYGFDYCFSESKNWHQILNSLMQNPHQDVLLPGVLQFFGHMVYLHPIRVLNEFPQIISLLFYSLRRTESVNVKRASLQTIGLLVKNNQTHHSSLSQQQSQLLEEFYSVLSDELISPSSESKAVSLNVLFEIVSSNVDDESLFTKIQLENKGSSIMSLLTTNISMPFTEIATPSIKILHLFSLTKWGSKLLATERGLINKICNLKSGNEDIKEIQGSIIQNLLGIQSNEDIFEKDIWKRMKEFDKEKRQGYSQEKNSFVEYIGA